MYFIRFCLLFEKKYVIRTISYNFIVLRVMAFSQQNLPSLLVRAFTNHVIIVSMFMLSFILCVFFTFVTVLSVLLQYTDSDYPFGIFKLFLEPH